VKAWTVGVKSLFGELAPPAQRFDFYRTAQQRELSQAGLALEKLLHFGDFDVVYASASDAQDVVMRLDVAVVAGDIVQQRYLAGLADFAELLQNPMDCRQRYVGMLATYRRADLVGAWMVLGSEQGLHDCEALGRYGYPALTASRDELAQSMNRIPFTGPRIHEPDFWHICVSCPTNATQGEPKANIWLKGDDG
jgi:hypothetical protein